MGMHVEVVEHKRVLSNFSWGPRAKISENLIDQWCEQGDIHPSILRKLVPLSSICSDTHNENLGDKNVPTILRPKFLAPHLFRPGAAGKCDFCHFFGAPTSKNNEKSISINYRFLSLQYISTCILQSLKNRSNVRFKFETSFWVVWYSWRYVCIHRC
jgi:hypothetical protein